ncbi:MAG: sce7726 family protein [Candidatus Dojkabacteria bacterium]|nr:MAG: sce7726 family protein [Candidatus Dojkabacteria bacterium]
MNNFITRDKTIRKVLMSELQNKYNGPDTAIIPEFSISNGSVRADIAVINGIMHCYELKGDLDNLFRLSAQANTYNLIFDKVTLVVGKSHVVEALRMIPDWWGITIAKVVDSEYEPKLISVRNAEENPAQDLLTIANMLWKTEALDILKRRNLAHGMNSKNKKEICEVLVKNFTERELKASVRECLVTRRQNAFYSL